MTLAQYLPKISGYWKNVTAKNLKHREKLGNNMCIYNINDMTEIKGFRKLTIILLLSMKKQVTVWLIQNNVWWEWQLNLEQHIHVHCLQVVGAEHWPDADIHTGFQAHMEKWLLLKCSNSQSFGNNLRWYCSRWGYFSSISMPSTYVPHGKTLSLPVVFLLF